MALEIFSDNSAWTFSPRISFSCDLSHTDRFGTDPGELDSTLLLGSPSSDFHFCLPQQNNYSSPADQLFSNGKILTLARSTSTSSIAPAPSSTTIQEFLEEASKNGAKQPFPLTTSLRSFWKFSRSSSLNYRSITKSGLLSTLNKLTRSKSLGSHTKQAASKKTPPPPPPPSAKVAGRSPEAGHNGARINPLFNVPPPYISGGRSSLFSLGYFLGRKEKNRKTF